MQWATMVVIEQMQRWRCPTYTPRTTVIAPYSSTEVVHALPEAEKFTLLFFRYAPLSEQSAAMSMAGERASQECMQYTSHCAMSQCAVP